MSWWIYKCNSKQVGYQRSYAGDWNDFFRDPKQEWGSTELVPALAILKRGDLIIAYQTDRNELVGLVKVRQSCARNSYLYLDPIETIGAKVRPLKRADPRISAIPALQAGPIQTIYDISESDARRLLIAAGSNYIARSASASRATPLIPAAKSEAANSGAGFGDSDKNAEVAAAAVQFVTNWHRARGWTVQSVESENRGYDLRCTKHRSVRDIEVKGVTAEVPDFIITAGEVKQARSNPNFVLCVVTLAVSPTPKLTTYSGSTFLERFTLEPMQFRAKLC